MRVGPIFYAQGESAKFSLSDTPLSEVELNNVETLSRLRDITGFDFDNGNPAECKSVTAAQSRSKLEIGLSPEGRSYLEHVPRAEVSSIGKDTPAFIIFGRFNGEENNLKQVIIAQRASSKNNFSVVFDSGIETSDSSCAIPELKLLVAFKQVEPSKDRDHQAVHSSRVDYIYHLNFGRKFVGNDNERYSSDSRWEPLWSPQNEDARSADWYLSFSRSGERNKKPRARRVFNDDPLVSFMHRNPHNREIYEMVEKMCSDRGEHETALFLLEASLTTGIPLSGYPFNLFRKLPMEKIPPKQLRWLISLARDDRNFYNSTAECFASKLFRYQRSKGMTPEQIGDAVNFKWVSKNKYHAFAKPYFDYAENAEIRDLARAAIRTIEEQTPADSIQTNAADIKPDEPANGLKLYSKEWGEYALEALTATNIKRKDLIDIFEAALAFDPKKVDEIYDPNICNVIGEIATSPLIIQIASDYLFSGKYHGLIKNFLLRNLQLEEGQRHPVALVFLKDESIRRMANLPQEINTPKTDLDKPSNDLKLYSKEWSEYALEALTEQEIEPRKLDDIFEAALAFDPKKVNEDYDPDINMVIMAIGVSQVVQDLVFDRLALREDLIDLLKRNSKLEQNERHPFARALLDEDLIREIIDISSTCNPET